MRIWWFFPSLVVSFGMGGVVGPWVLEDPAVIASHIVAFRAQLRAAEQRHEKEIAEFYAETSALKTYAETLEAAVAHLKFDIGHATLQAYESVRATAAYDFDRMLARNPGGQKYFPYLLNAVDHYKDIWPVDPMFALSILRQESDFGRHLVSKAGALGDAQFIESTARRYGLDVREPWSWKKGRRHFSEATELRSQARAARDRFLKGMRPVSDAEWRTPDDRLLQQFHRYARDLGDYYRLNAEAAERKQRGEAAYGEYKHEVEAVLAGARDLERQVQKRQLRERQLIRVSRLRPEKTEAELHIERQLIVNDYLASYDPRLSPMYLTDALVHHLADLFREFKGDRRLVASRYNASRRAMEAAVARFGGGVGIPLLDETQDYVNKVVVLHAFLAADAGIMPSDFDVSVGARYASR